MHHCKQTWKPRSHRPSIHLKGVKERKVYARVSRSFQHGSPAGGPVPNDTTQSAQAKAKSIPKVPKAAGKGKAKAKTLPKAPPKAKATPKPKAEAPAPAKPSGSVEAPPPPSQLRKRELASKAKAAAAEPKTKVLKKPAAAAADSGRPSALKFSVHKGYYKRNRKYGFKIGGSEKFYAV